MRCLILGNHTQGLGILRSLRHTGIPLHVVNDRLVSLCRFSRFLHRYHVLERDTLKAVCEPENEKRLLNFVNRFIPEGSRWPVFCVHEDLVHFLHRNREALCGRLAIPSNPILEIVDKYRFASVMDNIGVDTPRTFLLSEFDPGLLKNGSYLMKGRLGNRFRNLSQVKGMEIRDSSDLEEIQRNIDGSVSADDVLIQEKIVRNDRVLSCCGLSIEGNLVRHFQYVKLRQHPDQFGTGTFLKSIWDSRILELARRIIGHFAYTGIFEIEFLRQEGRCTVIEMNPRTWKSIHFATQCGQNMCAGYVDYLRTGKAPKADMKYSIGRTWVDLGTDIPVLIKKRLWLKTSYTRNLFFCVLDRRDPLPFIMEIALAPLLKLDI